MTKRRQNKKVSSGKKGQSAQQQARPRFSWLQHWLPGLLLLLLPFLLYGTSLKFGYVLDDKIVLSENQFVQKGLEGIGDIFSTESFTGFLGEQQDLVAGARYRPFSIATFAVEHELWGAKPGRSHFINILFYALTGLLVYRLIFVFGLGKGKWYWSLPFVAAVLYLAHPIHTEVVANIKGRDEILALLLSLASLFYAFRYIQRSSWLALLLSGILFFLGLMAKENTLTFLAVVPLSLYLFSKADTRKTILATAPLLAATIAYLLIRVSVIGYLLDSGKEITGIMNDPFVGTTLSEKYATITYTLGEYIRLLVFPHPLTHDYYPYQVPILSWGDWRVMLSLLLNLGILVLGIWRFRKLSVPAWSVFYYFITLSIVSNIVVSLGAPMNERFLYMPSLGFCLGLAYLVKVPLAKRLGDTGSKVAMALLLAIVLGYSYKTITRVPDWENASTLNQAAIKVSTNSARANSYMAYSLYQAGLQETNPQKQRELYQQALPYVNRALEIYPEYSDAITCKGGLVAGLYQQDGDLPKLLDAFYDLLSRRHVAFLEQYLEYLNGRANPQQMANFYFRAGYELLVQQKQDYPRAIQYLNYGLQLAPQDQRLLEAAVIAYAKNGNAGKVQELCERGRVLYPGSEVFGAYCGKKSGTQ